MIEKVVIKDNKKTPIKYLSDLKSFKNGTEYIFKPGVNVIIGENGCGKTTLMNLIRAYLVVGLDECDKGEYNHNINKLFRSFMERDELLDGADVYADYERNTFRFCHLGEKTNDDLKTFNDFGIFFEQKHASTGEGVRMALAALFEKMFSKDAKLTYDYSQFEKYSSAYTDYINSHKVKGDEWTILMDEPDRNLDIEVIEEIKGILSFHKPHTQIIAVVHNPLLIYSLSNNPDVNLIEMTKGYAKKVRKVVDELLK